MGNAFPYPDRRQGDISHYRNGNNIRPVRAGSTTQVLGWSSDGTPLAVSLTTAFIPDRTRNFFIPAKAFDATGEGTPDLAVRGSTTYQTVNAWAFDGANDESITTSYLMPADYTTLAALTPTLHWAASTADAGNVHWQILIGSLAAGDLYDEAIASQSDTVVAASATATKYQASALNTVTPTNLTDFLRVVVRRNASAVNDTYNAHDAHFMGISFSYTADM